MGQNTCRPNNKDSLAEGFVTAFARDQAISCRECELHAVGKADDHDQRCHEIQKQIEVKVEPAECAEAQQDGYQGRPRGDHHE